MDFDPRKNLQDTAYVTVGVGVITFQQAQVRRRELAAKVSTEARKALNTVQSATNDARAKTQGGVGGACSLAQNLTDEVRSWVEPVVGDLKVRVDPVLDQLQNLPGRVNLLVDTGRARVRSMVDRAA